MPNNWEQLSIEDKLDFLLRTKANQTQVATLAQMLDQARERIAVLERLVSPQVAK